MLKLIKAIHTVIWAVMASAAFYILYAGVMGIFNALVLISIILLTLETIVLLFNRWTCPLTPLAGRYTKERSDNFDIYLPLWLARHNKTIFGTIFTIGIFLLILKYFSLA